MEEDDCPICFESLVNDEIIITECNHTFHKKCIDKWLKIKNICPICKTKFKLQEREMTLREICKNLVDIVQEVHSTVRIFEFTNLYICFNNFLYCLQTLFDKHLQVEIVDNVLLNCFLIFNNLEISYYLSWNTYYIDIFIRFFLAIFLYKVRNLNNELRNNFFASISTLLAFFLINYFDNCSILFYAYFNSLTVSKICFCFFKSFITFIMFVLSIQTSINEPFVKEMGLEIFNRI